MIGATGALLGAAPGVEIWMVSARIPHSYDGAISEGHVVLTSRDDFILAMSSRHGGLRPGFVSSVRKEQPQFAANSQPQTSVWTEDLVHS
ncbi:hypothetical protein RRG08_000936 [Elysia crispata]|uniref:Uncharacterized protein n=1 Tax=Elysia crispata TaxID=231223 RepID=A0AAE1AF52_9GAST|nr:hypothetical protein RRG08_000936 [Elysia crispata]